MTQPTYRATKFCSKLWACNGLRVLLIPLATIPLTGFSMKCSVEAPTCNGAACTDGGTLDTEQNDSVTSDSQQNKPTIPTHETARAEIETARKRRQAYLHGGAYDVNGDGIDDVEISVEDGYRRMYSRDENGEIILVLERTDDGTVQQWDLRLSGDQRVLWRSGGHSIRREDTDSDGILDSETEVIIDRTTNTTTIIVREREDTKTNDRWKEIWKQTRSGTASHALDPAPEYIEDPGAIIDAEVKQLDGDRPRNSQACPDINGVSGASITSIFPGGYQISIISGDSLDPADTSLCTPTQATRIIGAFMGLLPHAPLLSNSISCLHSVNPDLKSDLEDALQTKRILITCGECTGALGSYHPDPIHIGPFQADAHIDLSSSAIDQNIEALKEVLLHELMHSVRTHTWSKYGHDHRAPRNGRGIDQVYGCGRLCGGCVRWTGIGNRPDHTAWGDLSFDCAQCAGKGDEAKCGFKWHTNPQTERVVIEMAKCSTVRCVKPGGIALVEPKECGGHRLEACNHITIPAPIYKEIDDACIEQCHYGDLTPSQSMAAGRMPFLISPSCEEERAIVSDPKYDQCNNKPKDRQDPLMCATRYEE